LSYIIYYDDEYETESSLKKWPEAIARGSGASVARNKPGLKIDIYTDPTALIRWIEAAPSKSPPTVLVLDVHTQAKARAITADSNCGFAIAREANAKWPRVPLIFLTMFESHSTHDMSAFEFPGYKRFITKRGDNAVGLLEQTIERVCEGVQELCSGRLRIEPSSRKVYWMNEELVGESYLTDREFRMVDCIMKKCLSGAPRALYRDILLAIGANEREAIYPLMTRVKDKLGRTAHSDFGRRDIFFSDREGYLLVERNEHA
jgi:hypothetical protein